MIPDLWPEGGGVQGRSQPGGRAHHRQARHLRHQVPPALSDGHAGDGRAGDPTNKAQLDTYTPPGTAEKRYTALRSRSPVIRSRSRAVPVLLNRERLQALFGTSLSDFVRARLRHDPVPTFPTQSSRPAARRSERLSETQPGQPLFTLGEAKRRSLPMPRPILAGFPPAAGGSKGSRRPLRAIGWHACRAHQMACRAR